jgi:hypothetical protein
VTEHARLRDPEIFGSLLGARLVEVTDGSVDPDAEEGTDFVYLHFDTGHTVIFPIGEKGFEVLNS